jgi:hypothetical protein
VRPWLNARDSGVITWHEPQNCLVSIVCTARSVACEAITRFTSVVTARKPKKRRQAHFPASADDATRCARRLRPR